MRERKISMIWMIMKEESKRKTFYEIIKIRDQKETTMKHEKEKDWMKVIKKMNFIGK
jgi:predicted patatin/cPLA2 family phospholipase